MNGQYSRMMWYINTRTIPRCFKTRLFIASYLHKIRRFSGSVITDNNHDHRSVLSAAIVSCAVMQRHPLQPIPGKIWSLWEYYAGSILEWRCTTLVPFVGTRGTLVPFHD